MNSHSLQLKDYVHTWAQEIILHEMQEQSLPFESNFSTTKNYDWLTGILWIIWLFKSKQDILLCII